MIVQRLLNLLLTAFASAAIAADGGGFLFVTFDSEGSQKGEQIYFGLSKDGIRWEALNGREPVLVSTLGEKGVRDPYLLRAEDGKFCLIATDLSIYLHPDWKRAVQAGSRSIVIWESGDLVDWSAPRLVGVAPPDAGCTWAPEAIYDIAGKRHLVYWASTTRTDNFVKQRIWGAWTKDFRTFSEPFIFIQKPTTIIDTDIVRGDDGKYYRFTKDEKFKAITMEVSDSLTSHWTDVSGFSLAQMKGYEGPACYRLTPAQDGKPVTWCLLLDNYAQRGGYKPFISTNLASGKFTPGASFEFPFHFRHGSVLPITASEYERLKAHYGSSRKERASAEAIEQGAANPFPTLTPSATVDVWPEGKMPGAGAKETEAERPSKDAFHRITNVSRPALSLFPAPKKESPAPAMIVCPGGGYNYVVVDKEGAEIAAWLNTNGVTALVLKYRVPKNRAGALQDVQRALSLTRAHAAEWNIDPKRLGVIGFSAGGNLAAKASTRFDERTYPAIDATDQQTCRPDFAVLLYPAYLDDKNGHVAADLNLKANIPPTLIVHSEDDKTFVPGSKLYHAALEEAKVEHEFKLYPTGGHGYGLHCTNEARAWPECALEWLHKIRIR